MGFLLFFSYNYLRVYGFYFFCVVFIFSLFFLLYYYTLAAPETLPPIDVGVPVSGVQAPGTPVSDVQAPGTPISDVQAPAKSALTTSKELLYYGSFYFVAGVVLHDPLLVCMGTSMLIAGV